MNEELTKARDSAAFVAQDLRAALKFASPVEALLLLPMIGRAETLRQEIAALLMARVAGG